MIKKLDKNSDAAWKDFEKSGSIEAFLLYHQVKLSKASTLVKGNSGREKSVKKK